MSRYRKWATRAWADEKFLRLSKPQPNGQTIWQFLVTGPFASPIPGVVIAKPGMIASYYGWDSPDTIRDAFEDAFQEVIREGLAKANRDAGLIVLPGAWKVERDDDGKLTALNKPQAVNTVKSWRRTWPEVPECDLKVEAWEGLRAFTYAFGDTFADAFADACPRPCRIQERGEGRGDSTPHSPPTGGQLALTNPEPAPEAERLPGEDTLRPERARKFLAEHREEALRQFRRQNALRAEVRKRLGLRVTELQPNAERVAKIAERLAAGVTPEECEHVLQVYAAEAIQQRTAEHFNGMTNWRAENFNRALGKPLPKKPTEPTHGAANRQTAGGSVHRAPEDAGV